MSSRDGVDKLSLLSDVLRVCHPKKSTSVVSNMKFTLTDLRNERILIQLLFMGKEKIERLIAITVEYFFTAYYISDLESH